MALGKSSTRKLRSRKLDYSGRALFPRLTLTFNPPTQPSSQSSRRAKSADVHRHSLNRFKSKKSTAVVLVYRLSTDSP